MTLVHGHSILLCHGRHVLEILCRSHVTDGMYALLRWSYKDDLRPRTIHELWKLTIILRNIIQIPKKYFRFALWPTCIPLRYEPLLRSWHTPGTLTLIGWNIIKIQLSVRKYCIDKGSSYVYIVTLTSEIWHWVNVTQGHNISYCQWQQSYEILLR